LPANCNACFCENVGFALDTVVHGEVVEGGVADDLLVGGAPHVEEVDFVDGEAVRDFTNRRVVILRSHIVTHAGMG